MNEKIGKDVLKKRFRKEIENVNQTRIQIRVLEELSKRRMDSKELRSLVEHFGGDYDLILPKLKESGLLKVERNGWTYIYSLNKTIPDT